MRARVGYEFLSYDYYRSGYDSMFTVGSFSSTSSINYEDGVIEFFEATYFGKTPLNFLGFFTPLSKDWLITKFLP